MGRQAPSPFVVCIHEGHVQDHVSIEGNFVAIERWILSQDPRDDTMVRSAIAIRFPIALWPQYQAQIEKAMREHDA